MAEDRVAPVDLPRHAGAREGAAVAFGNAGQIGGRRHEKLGHRAVALQARTMADGAVFHEQARAAVDVLRQGRRGEEGYGQGGADHDWISCR